MAHFSAYLNPVLVLFSCDLCLVRASKCRRGARTGGGGRVGPGRAEHRSLPRCPGGGRGLALASAGRRPVCPPCRSPGPGPGRRAPAPSCRPAPLGTGVPCPARHGARVAGRPRMALAAARGAWPGQPLLPGTAPQGLRPAPGCRGL